MSEHAVEIRELSKRFGRKPVLRGVDLAVEQGRIAAVVGPNGSGKTTLFSLVAGFLQPDEGEVRLFGRGLSSLSSLGGRLGILPQDARFLAQIGIRQHFVWYARLMGFGPSDARAEADRVLRAVGLAEVGGRDGDRLSHGMHKRAAIAQALIGEPPLLILDEPTAGLDPVTARSIRELIVSLRKRATILVSSHDLGEIGDLCDHVTILDRGRLVESDTMASFTRQEALLTLVLAEEAPQGLVEALAARDEVADVRTGREGTRLVCTVAADAVDDPELIAALIRTVNDHEGSFVQLTKGSTLEDRFLEVTGSGAAS